MLNFHALRSSSLLFLLIHSHSPPHDHVHWNQIVHTALVHSTTLSPIAIATQVTRHRFSFASTATTEIPNVALVVSHAHHRHRHCPSCTVLCRQEIEYFRKHPTLRIAH